MRIADFLSGHIVPHHSDFGSESEERDSLDIERISRAIAAQNGVDGVRWRLFRDDAEELCAFSHRWYEETD